MVGMTGIMRGAKIPILGAQAEWIRTLSRCQILFNLVTMIEQNSTLNYNLRKDSYKGGKS